MVASRSAPRPIVRQNMSRLLQLICALTVAATVHGQSSPAPTPISSALVARENLGLGLRQIVKLFQQDQAHAHGKIASTRSIMSDASGRVVVNIHLDGRIAPTQIAAQLSDLGLEIMAVETHWRSGVISAWLPVAQATSVANLPGVQSVMLARRPLRRAGAVTAESSVVEHAREVNAPGTVTTQGILGRNISVGIVSDSFDGATGVPRASVGVASGDLPGPGNPDGYTQPVLALKDDVSSSSTDEGRGMAEIVHDIAPAAKICFAAA